MNVSRGTSIAARLLIAVFTFAGSALAGISVKAQDVVNTVNVDGAGVITDMVINGVPILQSEFVDVTLTDFSYVDSAAPDFFLLSGTSSPPPSPPSSAVRGFNVDSGLANGGFHEFTFDSAVVNTAGADIALMDIGRLTDADFFDLTINGTTVQYLPSEAQLVFTSDRNFDLYAPSANGPYGSVPALDAETFSFLTSANSQRRMYLIELDDFGVAAGASIGTADLQGFDGFDVMSVFGLPEIAPPIPGVISAVDLGPGSVVNSITIRGTEVFQSQLINSSMTGFTDSDTAQLILPSASSPPNPVSSVLSDFSLSTGVANYDTLTVAFDSPVENTPNEDIIIADIGIFSDEFEVTINGTTVSFPAVSQDFSTDPFLFDIHTSDGLGPFNTVADLDTEFYSPTVLDAEASSTFVVLDLDDFGIAPGATVTSLEITNTATPEFDTVAVFGLPEVIPTFNGDFDLDGDVDVSDVLDWQRNDGGFLGLIGWQANFTGQPPAIEAGVAVVPEPHSLLLALCGIVLLRGRCFSIVC